MNARTILLALILLASRVEAGAIDKPKLRKLAELPTVNVAAGSAFSKEKVDPAVEIARLRKLLAERKTPEEVVAAARKRIDKKDNAHNRFLLAKIYESQTHFEKAVEQLRIGLQREPRDLDCCLGLAALLLKREAKALKEAGERLDTVEERMEKTKDKSRQTNYLLLRGIHAALNDRPERAKEMFKQILQQDKGNESATRALVALSDPFGPAEEQIAVDYLRKRGGDVERDDERPGSPVVDVRLIGKQFTDEDVFFLAMFSQLRTLDLVSLSITDAGLCHLKNLTALRDLRLEIRGITDEGLSHIRGLTKLRHLWLDEVKITDAGFAHLEGFRNLERLYLTQPIGEENNSITDAGLAHLRKLSKLREVSLWIPITDKGLAHLAALPRLRRLHMTHSKITEEGMRQFEKCTELRQLWLSGGRITDAGLVHLKGLQQLRELRLDNTKITDAGLVHLKKLARLERLALGDTAITDAGLVHLGGMTNLCALDVSDSQSQMGISLPRFPGEYPTFLKSPRITDAGMKHLQGLINLGNLNLDGCPITDAGLAHLHKLKRLEYVNLIGTKVTPKGIADLRNVFPKLKVYR